MADSPIKTIDELQLGPYDTTAGQVQAIRQIQQKLNEVIRVLNAVVVRVNADV